MHLTKNKVNANDQMKRQEVYKINGPVEPQIMDDYLVL